MVQHGSNAIWKRTGTYATEFEDTEIVDKLSWSGYVGGTFH